MCYSIRDFSLMEEALTGHNYSGEPAFYSTLLLGFKAQLSAIANYIMTSWYTFQILLCYKRLLLYLPPKLEQLLPFGKKKKKKTTILVLSSVLHR